MSKQETQRAPRRAPVLMPGGKYINLPVNMVQDAYVLLWNISPKGITRLNPQQIEAIYKQAGKILKANGWKFPAQEKPSAKPKPKKARAKK